MSVFGVFLIRIFPHLERIRRDTKYLSIFSWYAGKKDQENTEYEHFSRGVSSGNEPVSL